MVDMANRTAVGPAPMSFTAMMTSMVPRPVVSAPVPPISDARALGRDSHQRPPSARDREPDDEDDHGWPELRQRNGGGVDAGGDGPQDRRVSRPAEGSDEGDREPDCEARQRDPDPGNPDAPRHRASCLRVGGRAHSRGRWFPGRGVGPLQTARRRGSLHDPRAGAPMENEAVDAADDEQSEGKPQAAARGSPDLPSPCGAPVESEMVDAAEDDGGNGKPDGAPRQRDPDPRDPDPSRRRALCSRGGGRAHNREWTALRHSSGRALETQGAGERGGGWSVAGRSHGDRCGGGGACLASTTARP